MTSGTNSESHFLLHLIVTLFVRNTSIIVIMGNTQPRIKLHYVKEHDRVVTGLIQILDLPKGTSIDNLDVYVIGREKISWVSGQNFATLKESHTFFKEKVVIKATDNEPTFSIQLPEDLPPSGHGGNYGYALKKGDGKDMH